MSAKGVAFLTDTVASPARYLTPKVYDGFTLTTVWVKRPYTMIIAIIKIFNIEGEATVFANEATPFVFTVLGVCFWSFLLV